MKLELKHLSGYLPYGLKAFRENKSVPSDTFVIKGATKENVFLSENGLVVVDIDRIKPILRPLSDLTRKELELEGFDSYIDYLTYENKGSQWTLKAPFNMVQYLLSQHFDIYGLIENNLAIDKNTIL